MKISDYVGMEVGAVVMTLDELIEACDKCQDRKAIAVPGEDYACREHQAMIDKEGA